MASKQKRVVLTVGEKYKIIKDLENDESATKLAIIHGVRKSTIMDIIRVLVPIGKAQRIRKM